MASCNYRKSLDTRLSWEQSPSSIGSLLEREVRLSAKYGSRQGFDSSFLATMTQTRSWSRSLERRKLWNRHRRSWRLASRS